MITPKCLQPVSPIFYPWVVLNCPISMEKLCTSVMRSRRRVESLTGLVLVAPEYPFILFLASLRTCYIKDTCHDNAIATAHGFPISFFTLILLVSILEASEASGASTFAFTSTLVASASTILYCVTKTPPSPVPPYFPAVKLSSCLKYTLGDVYIKTVHGFLTLFFHQPYFCLHLTIFPPLFLL